MRLLNVLLTQLNVLIVVSHSPHVARHIWPKSASSKCLLN